MFKRESPILYYLSFRLPHVLQCLLGPAAAALVHQSIAAEHEFLESLFRLKSDGRMVGSIYMSTGFFGSKYLVIL